MRILRALGALLVGATFALPLVPTGGCVPLCPTIDRFTTDGQGTTYPDGSGVFETSPIGGPFLPFEGGTVLHIHHGLGRVPTSVDVYESFSEMPTQTASGGFSGTAGNQAIVLDATEQDVVVRNDTCSDFYVRVVVRTDAGLDAGGDAGGDALTDAVSDGG